MNGTNRLLIVFVIGFALCGTAPAGFFDAAWIKGETDRPPVSYRVNEPIRFTLTVQNVDVEIPSGAFFLSWRRTGDDGDEESGKVPLSQEPFSYTTQARSPGFVRIYAVIVDENGKRVTRDVPGRPKTISFDGGAGAEIETLLPHPEPSDFDAFWSRQFDRLAHIPVKAEYRRVQQENDRVRVCAVSVDCAGLRPMTGYLSVPVATEADVKFPCVLALHGYDGDNFVQPLPKSFPADRIQLDINAHGLKLPEFGATDADTKALRWACRSNGCQYAFDELQNRDPETAYFNGMVLRVKRALQFLKTLPEWNGVDLRASGGSQGGLQAVWAAACGEGVTSATSSITWCCDIFTNAKRKVQEVHRDGWGDGWYIAWTEAMGYYDAINFAKRIPSTCRLEIPRAGLGDYCCPPMGLAKLWNCLNCPAKITWVQGSEHGHVPPKYEGRDFIVTKAQ